MESRSRTWPRSFGPLWFVISVAALLSSCDGRPRAVTSGKAGATLALSDDVPFAALEFPTDSRGGRAPSQVIPLLGPWRDGGVQGGVRTWIAPLPVRPRAMFFMRPPDGMEVVTASGDLLAFGTNPRTWGFDATSIFVHRASAAPAPTPAEYRLRYPFSIKREARLNGSMSNLEKEDFVRATVQVGPESRRGLLLPAPGRASWDVTVPVAGELHFQPVLVSPEVADLPPSDGVTLAVDVEGGGGVTPLWTERVQGADSAPVRLDLSRWAGQAVRITFRSLPGPEARFDYAFFSDPVLASRKSDPRRVVMLFVDTLRPDHLGIYGGERDTSQPMDEWARANAVVFEQAHSVAPWTLPSTRSILTGRQPEFYPSVATLPGRLRSAGFATAMFSGNLYLSANFDMERDWGLHRADLFPTATEQVDRALGWLEAQGGRDALLLVHFMDCHLPYQEPLSYRYRYAALAPPAGLGERFERTKVVQAKLKSSADRAYVRDRYDNNVAYVHDEIARLLARLSPGDIVVYFSDHGEEFWDHRQFEHGHSLHEELLHVPLILRVPGLAPGRVSQPVSLLDVTPTVLDALGMSDPRLDGQSLLSVARGDVSAQTALEERVLSFGRPLYGSERWGAMQGVEKYTSGEGVEALFNLVKDKGELANLITERKSDPSEWRKRLGLALDREVQLGFRLMPGRVKGGGQQELRVEVSVPGGVSAAWVGEDPTSYSAAEVSFKGDILRATWPGGFLGAREVFFTSNRNALEAVPGMVLKALAPEKVTAPVPEDPHTQRARLKPTLVKINVGGRPVSLTWAVAPRPLSPEVLARPTHATDVEVQESLRALGYTFDDAGSDEP